MSAQEAKEANQKDIERTAKMCNNITRISNSHAEMIFKFEHQKKKAKRSNKKSISDYTKP